MNEETRPVITCKRHKWQWLKNVEIWRIGLRNGSMKLRGLYKCAKCGDKKHGQPGIKP